MMYYCGNLFISGHFVMSTIYAEPCCDVDN